MLTSRNEPRVPGKFLTMDDDECENCGPDELNETEHKKPVGSSWSNLLDQSIYSNNGALTERTMVAKMEFEF